MSTIDVDNLAQIIRQVDGNHDLGAGALAEAIIDRLPDPQVIRTVEELEALDPDTVIQTPMDELGLWPVAISARSLAWYMRSWNWNSFPAVVIATAEQVRAARKAMEGA